MRSRAVQSIKETKQHFEGRTGLMLDHLYARLAEKILELDDDELPLPPLAWKMALGLLSSYLPEPAKKVLTETLEEDLEPARQIIAIELLSEHYCSEIAHFFAGLLESKGRSKGFYQSLGVALNRSKDKIVKEVAQKNFK